MGETAQLDGVTVEQAINRSVRAAPMKMTPALLHAMIGEVARGYQDIEDIAVRYGFDDAKALYDTIAASPALLRAIKQERAVWQSEENLERRLRVQHQLILHEAAHENAKPLFDPSTTVPQRVELMKAIAVVGGVHGMPGGGGRGMDGAADQAARWTIQMVFPNAGKVEEISLRPTPSPPTIDAETD